MIRQVPYLRPLGWIGSSKRDYMEFPLQVQDQVGFALHLAQAGLKSPSAKMLKGLGGGILEVVEDFDGDTYRTVYTVRFEEIVYVLHAFKKKSKQGIKTPQHEIDLVKRRLRDAETHHAQTYGKEARK